MGYKRLAGLDIASAPDPSVFGLFWTWADADWMQLQDLSPT